MKRKPQAKPAIAMIAVGDRVKVSITVAAKDGAVPRPAFGVVIALDQVAVLIDGELDARAYEPRAVAVRVRR